MSEVQNAQAATVEELKFQRRYLQVRLNELKLEREDLVAKKQTLEAQIAERRGRKQDGIAAGD